MPTLRSADLFAQERSLQHATADSVTQGSSADFAQPQGKSVSLAEQQISVTSKALRKQQKRSSSSKGKATVTSSERAATLDPAVQPAPKKRAKFRKAILSTLWSAEEIAPLQTKVEQLYTQLNELYEDPPCPLNYDSPFQLLVAVILSAQVCSKH